MLVVAACTETSVKPPPTAPRVPESPSTGVLNPFNDQGNCIGEDYAAGGGGGSITETKGCTANDIRVAQAEILEYSFDGNTFEPFTGATVECDAGTPLFLRLRAFLVETATSTRSDIGVWVANDGGTARRKLPPPSGSLPGYGLCNHYNLAPAPALTDPFTVVDGVTNVDGDQCGDMFPTAATQDSASLDLGQINTICQGSTPTSTLVHVGSCLSWTVPGGDRVCPTDEAASSTGFRLGTLPSASSKCNCEGFDVPITVRQSAKLEIVKACSPTNDAGKFNLQIDDVTEKADAACGGTTGSKTVGAGTTASPGASHSFAELAGTGTSLTDYTSSFTCTNRSDGSTHASTGSGTSGSLTLQPAEDVICTITNVRKPQVKLVKDLDPDADAGRFDLTIAGTTYDNGGVGYGDLGNTGFQTVSSGSVIISEAAHTGTSLSDYVSTLSCVKQGGASVTVSPNNNTSGTISAGAGDQVTCTFLNKRKPEVKLVKDLDPDADPGRFDLTIAATTFNNGGAGYGDQGNTGFQKVAIGSVNISEAAHTGTSLTDYTTTLSCVKQGGASVTVSPNNNTSGTITTAPGDQITCTFLNTKGAALKLVKTLDPTTDAGKFDFTIGASSFTNGGAGYGHNGTTNFQPVPLGSVSFSELAHSGTSLADYNSTVSCVKQGGASVTISPNNNTSGTITTNPGDQVTCTFVNVRKPQVKLVKDLDPDADAGRFDLTIGATTYDNGGSGYGDQGNTGFVNVAIGSVNISEAAHAGTSLSDYVSTLSCVKQGGASVTVSPNNNTSGTISAGAGDQITCTFINKRKPEVKLVKDLVPNADAGLFDLTIAGTTYNNSGAGYGDNGTTGFKQVSIGSVAISEAGHGTTALGDYVTTLSCDNGKVVNPNNNTSGTISVVAGDRITCTFVNTRKPRVKLVKDLVPDADAGRFDLTIAGTTYNNSGAGYGDQGTTGFQNVAVGSVNISEAAHAGTTLSEYASSLSCDNGKTVSPNNNTSGTISVTAGEQITCTFVNNHQPKLTITKTPDAGGAGYNVSPGGTATFTVVISNASNAGPALNVQLVDTLPAGVGDWTESPDQTECTITALPGETAKRLLSCDETKGGLPNELVQLNAGASFTVVVQATVPTDFLQLPPSNVGSTPLEIEGNLVSDGGRDWVTVNPSLVDCTTTPKKGCDIDKPTGTTDDSFGQGTSEDTPVPTVVAGSIPNNKSDLLRFYVANERIQTTDWLYLAWERVQAPNGTTNMDFELNQSSTLSGNGVTPVRTAGDILIKYDLSNGGTNPVLGYHKWITSGTCAKNGGKAPCWGPVQTLSAAQGVIGAINHVSVSDPINPDAPRSLDSLTFGEARIDLETSGIFQPGACVSFGSAYLKSRSSDSFSAEIKDFIAPIAIMVTNCAPKNLDNRAWARASNFAPTGGSLNGWFSDTGQIHVAEAGSSSRFFLDTSANRQLAAFDGATELESSIVIALEVPDLTRRGATLRESEVAGSPWPPGVETLDPSTAAQSTGMHRRTVM